MEEGPEVIQLNTAAGRPRDARLSETTIRKHKHLPQTWCLCFRIVVSLQTAACRPPFGQLRDSPGFDSSILRIFASSRRPVQRDPPDFVSFASSCSS